MDAAIGGEALRRAADEYLVRPLKKRLTEDQMKAASEIVVELQSADGQTQLAFVPVGDQAAVGAGASDG